MTIRTPRLGWLVLAGAALLASPAAAQFGRPDPSPVAPGDLSKPLFDTKTPIYDVGKTLERSANTIVAEVDGRPIMLSEVGDAIRDLPGSLSALPFDTLYPIILDQLIKQQALVIAAQQVHADDDPTIRRRVRLAAEKALANEYLRREAAQQVTEAVLLDRYKQDYAGKPGESEVHTRVIMVPTEAEAAGIIAELKAGADFVALAKRSSRDVTGPSGGDLGFLRRDRLNPELAAVAFALRPGTVPEFPVRSNNAWFVLKVEERRNAPAPRFPEIREQLLQSILREKVPELTRTAVSGVVVRDYPITGKEGDEKEGTSR